MEPTLYRLKEIGHDRIYDLVELGMRLNGNRGIYERLRKKLKCAPGKEHFSRMTTFVEVEAAVEALTEMRHQRRKLKRNPLTEKAVMKQIQKENLSKKEEKALYRKIVPRAERDRAFAEIHKIQQQKFGEITLPSVIPAPESRRSLKSTVHTLLLRLFHK